MTFQPFQPIDLTSALCCCGAGQGCWRRHEDELAAQAEEGSKQKAAGQPVLSKEQDKAQKQQIFSR
jgi:hypothetical protein